MTLDSDIHSLNHWASSHYSFRSYNLYEIYKTALRANVVKRKLHYTVAIGHFPLQMHGLYYNISLLELNSCPKIISSIVIKTNYIVLFLRVFGEIE